MDKMLLQVYGDSFIEFEELKNNQIDFSGSNPPPGRLMEFKDLAIRGLLQLSSYHVNGMIQIDLNRFKPPTDNVHFRHAVAHLVDKEAFIADILGGDGLEIHNPIPLPTMSFWNLANTTNKYDARLGPDYCEAVQHLKEAGYHDSNNDCKIEETPRVVFYVVSGNAVLDGLARSLTDAMVAVGINVEAIYTVGTGFARVNLTKGQRGAAGVIVYSWAVDPAAEGPAWDDWNIHTGMWFFPFEPDYLSMYHSSLAPRNSGDTSICDGQTLPCTTSNYVGYSNPDFDRQVELLASAGDLDTALRAAWNAQWIFANDVPVVPVASQIKWKAYRPGWTGALNEVGSGVDNAWTFLNTYNSNPPMAGTIRYGVTYNPGNLETRIDSLHPIYADSPIERKIISLLYDSLLRSHPVPDSSGAETRELFSWLANKWQAFNDGVGLGYTPPTGTRKTIRFVVTSNFAWQDTGVVKAEDVRFSILAYRDVPGAVLQGSVSDVIDVTVQSDTLVDVHLKSASIFLEGRIGLLPIIPRRIWDVDGDWVLDMDKRLPYDPVASGSLIGSGPWSCKSLSGQIGRGCTTDGTDDVLAGSALSLSRFTVYRRGLDRAFKWDWSDKGNDGKVEISDVAGVALCNDKPATGECAYWDFNGNGKVDITEFGIVSYFYGTQWVYPMRYPGQYRPGSTLDTIWKSKCNILPQPDQNYCLTH